MRHVFQRHIKLKIFKDKLFHGWGEAFSHITYYEHLYTAVHCRVYINVDITLFITISTNLLWPLKDTGETKIGLLVSQISSNVSLLLALQSGALRRGAYRDFHPIPVFLQLLSILASIYTKAFRPVSGSMWQSMVNQILADLGRDRQSQVQPGTVR